MRARTTSPCVASCRHVVVMCVLVGLLAHSCLAVVRLNEIQFVKTHNSYHIANSLAAIGHPELRFNHDTLEDQLNSGVRGFEFDIPAESDSDDYPVFHDPNDAGTHCSRLSICIDQLREWSERNQPHHAIFVMIEVKDVVADMAKTAASIESTILSVLGISQVVTVADVKQGHGSLREAVKTSGWPTTDQTRGKFLFNIEYHNDQERDEQATITTVFNSTSHLFLLGRSEFSVNNTAAVIMIPTDSEILANSTSLKGMVADKLLLRAKVDTDLTLLPDLYQASLVNGINVIDTDFPTETNLSPEGFFVYLEGGTPSRCNPLTAAPGCTSTQIENTGTGGREVDTKRLSGGFWCCTPPLFHWSSLGITFVMLLLHILLHCVRCCKQKDRRWKNVNAFLLLYQSAIMCTVFTVRAVTDVILKRHDLESDDMFPVIAYFFASIWFVGACLNLVLLRFGEGWRSLLNTPAEQFSSNSAAIKDLFSSAWAQRGESLRPLLTITSLVVIVLMNFQALVYSATASNRLDGHQFGLGNLRTSVSYGFYIFLNTICVIQLAAQFLTRACPSPTHQRAWYLAFFLITYPQLLLLSIIGSIYISPVTSMLDLPTRVVVWHAIFQSVEVFTLSLLLPYAFDTSKSSAITTSVTEEVALHEQ